MSGYINVELPLDKLSFGFAEPEESSKKGSEDKKYVVLVSTGSFNPPTYMHLRIFELARDALNSDGFCVIGGYMSPVNDAYKKKGLIPAKHRIEMCRLACRSSEFIMVDPWEASQDTFQRTLTVLCRIRTSLSEGEKISGGPLKVMLACGSDLLESFSIPGVWIPEQNNIKVVDELVPNHISSTRIRDCISRGRSVKYLTANEVIDYIKQQRLYSNSSD